jgi:hypothetical protein
MRPYWKGHLKLALVSCPIALHAACFHVFHGAPEAALDGYERRRLTETRLRGWA